jgi:hypothetical protein
LRPRARSAITKQIAYQLPEQLAYFISYKVGWRGMYASRDAPSAPDEAREVSGRPPRRVALQAILASP